VSLLHQFRGSARLRIVSNSGSPQSRIEKSGFAVQWVGYPPRVGRARAVQLLLGHTKLESTVRYLGIEVDDALELAE